MTEVLSAPWLRPRSGPGPGPGPVVGPGPENAASLFWLQLEAAAAAAAEAPSHSDLGSALSAAGGRTGRAQKHSGPRTDQVPEPFRTQN